MAKSMKLGGGGRFQALKGKLSKREGVDNPGALAAYIGREKYGAKKMGQMSAAGRMRSHMPEGCQMSPTGDIGAMRGMEADMVARFKAGGKAMKAASYFGSAKPNASKEGNSPR